MSPLVSVVVVNFNGKKFLNACLDALLRQTFRDFEVILVDNGSTDGSAELIRDRYPSVILVSTGSNFGFAGGSNAGIRAARGQFIVTLNNDTVADPRLLEEIIKPVLEDPAIGMCAAKMVFFNGRINSTALCLSRSGAAWNRGEGEVDHGQWDNPEEVFGPCAGAALYRRSMLNEIGLFDEDFFLYMEDADLAFRGRLAGWRCRYVPAARVVHIHGGTAGTKSDIAIFYGNRNIVWFVVKDFPLRTLILSTPWIFGRNCATILYYLFQGKSTIIIRAKLSMIKGLAAMIRKRHAIVQRKPASDIERWIGFWSRVI